MHDYELIEELGQGTYSTVYRARRLSDNHIVALKQLKLPVGLDAYQETSLIERFRTEGDTARRLNHPNIVSIVDAGEDEGILYIAFEYVEGKTLQDELAKAGRFAPRRVVAMGRQLSEALAYAHDNGIIHRDIKPANIIIRPDGSAHISDFGVAIFVGGDTHTPDEGAAFVGTPQYSSPEQVTASPVDGRTDVFSLGAVLYEAASGQTAFSGESLGEVIHKITSVQAEPLKRIDPSFPPALENVIFKCLAKDPSFRYQSANDLTLALMEAMPEPGVGPDVLAPAIKPPPGEAVLLILSGPQEGREIKLHPSITTIGRKTGDVTFTDDDSLDNQHAWITKEDGGYYLYDAGTEAGTYVAGKKVDRIGLNHGDEITLGRQKLMYSGLSATETATDTKPLRPEDVLPPRKPLISKKGLIWGLPSAVILAAIILAVYFFSIAPARSASNFDKKLVYLYDAWELSFVQAEITSAETLLETARTVELPPFEEFAESLGDPNTANGGRVNIIQASMRDRYNFVKRLYDIVDILLEYDAANKSGTITLLAEVSSDIKKIRLIEDDDEWNNRMSEARGTIENFKAMLGPSQQGAGSSALTRENAATALYKVYLAYRGSGFSYDKTWDYFDDAEIELDKLQDNLAHSGFAKYNRAVLYYLMGHQLTTKFPQDEEAFGLFLDARDLVSKFMGRSSDTQQFQVSGIDEQLYFPSVLMANIEYALDQLEAQGYFVGE